MRNQAKDLHTALKAGDPSAIRRIEESHPRFSGLSEAEIAAAEVALTDAKLVIARELGFDSWPKLKAHLDAVSSPPSSGYEPVIGLKHLEGLSNLERLHLMRTRVGDSGLGYLKGLTSIERLGLARTQVSDAGLGHLEGLTNLKELNLYRTQVSDAGLQHLKALTSLRTLDLSFTQVTDAGLEHLQGLTTLDTLRLQLPQLTGAGLEYLTGLIGLRKLDLRFTQVTDARANEAKEALPDCKVYR